MFDKVAINTLKCWLLFFRVCDIWEFKSGSKLDGSILEYVWYLPSRTNQRIFNLHIYIYIVHIVLLFVSKISEPLINQSIIFKTRTCLLSRSSNFCEYLHAYMLIPVVRLTYSLIVCTLVYNSNTKVHTQSSNLLNCKVWS